MLPSRRDELDAALRDYRPAPPPELVRALVAKAEPSGGPRRALLARPLAAAALSSAMIAAFVGFGGIGYAASAAKQVASAAQSTASGKPSGQSNDTKKDSEDTRREDGKTSICHATGSATNPYVLITVDNSALPAHRAHQGLEDVIPAPEDDDERKCPGKEGDGPGDHQYGGKTTICHRTGSSSNPWVMISVSNSALPAHAAHGDIIPAPAAGCPAKTKK